MMGQIIVKMSHCTEKLTWHLKKQYIFVDIVKQFLTREKKASKKAFHKILIVVQTNDHLFVRIQTTQV